MKYVRPEIVVSAAVGMFVYKVGSHLAGEAFDFLAKHLRAAIQTRDGKKAA